MLTITLTPNRNPGPPRGVRMVIYRRDANHVDAFLAIEKGETGDVSVERRPWHMIRESAVDPEFESAWRQHVAYQRSLARDDQRA